MRTSAFRLGVVCLAVLVTACGGGGSGGGSAAAGPGGTSSGIGGDGSIGGAGNGPTGGTGGRDIIGDGGEGNSGSCVPTTCEAQGKSCGAIADGCGSTIDCGGCGEDEVCGLAVANVCAGIEDVCVRVSQEVACAGKACGVEGDGCGGTYTCGDNDGGCPDGQSCGLVTAYQCAAIPGGTPNECAARIESCDEVEAECGIIGNGCGGTIDCGGCAAGYLCGNEAGQPFKCGEYEACAPIEAEVACENTCGVVGDGCGGTYTCEAEGFGCTGGDTCGGGGVAFECGQEDDYSCEPVDDAAACAGKECGYAGDGCGTAIDCGALAGNGCGVNEQCKSNQCEAIVPGCTVIAQNTACAGKECGQVGNGCGGTYTCGSNGGGCGSGEQCGVLTAYQCDVPPPNPNDPGCVGRSQSEACAGKECGIAYDGCGTDEDHTYDCGSNGGACPGGTFCGAQAAYQCDPLPTPPACVRNGKTCDSEEWACGTFVDNCGITEDCGDCATGRTCMGGISTPTTCVSVAGNGGDDCPLCDAVPTTCDSNEITRLTGRVITPGQVDVDIDVNPVPPHNQVRVPNAFVYILRTNDTADLPAIGTGLPGSNGLSCDRCEDQDLGAVLVGDVTDANGNWTLEGNIPVDEEFLLITKVGKFRRAQRMTLPASAACTTTNLPTSMSTTGGETAGQGANDNPTRLPRSMSDGLAVNIPRMAITTGRIDAMECVFYKMGLAQAEFGNFSVSGTNRIDLYRGASSGSPEGASINGSTPHDTALYNDLSRMERYDMVVSDCEGQSWDSAMTQRGDGTDTSQGGKVRQYVNRGGRMVFTHVC